MQVTDALACGLIAWFDPKCSWCLWPNVYFNERVFSDLVTLFRYDNCQKTTAWFLWCYKCFNWWIKKAKVKECKERLCCYMWQYSSTLRRHIQQVVCTNQGADPETLVLHLPDTISICELERQCQGKMLWSLESQFM